VRYVLLGKGEDVEQRVEDEEGVWDGGRECVERYLGVTIAKGPDCEGKEKRRNEGKRMESGKGRCFRQSTMMKNGQIQARTHPSSTNSFLQRLR
jgi:hypothetical protein